MWFGSSLFRAHRSLVLFDVMFHLMCSYTKYCSWCAFAMLSSALLYWISSRRWSENETARERDYGCVCMCEVSGSTYENVYMHFNGTFEINKYQNKGLYGYGMFLVFPLRVRIVLAKAYWRTWIPRDLYTHTHQVKSETISDRKPYKN